MIPVLLSSLLACHEYSVTLDQTGTTPVPVFIGSTVEIPSGILATVLPVAWKDDERLYDAYIELETLDHEIVMVDPVSSDIEGEWAVLGVAPGTAEILATIDSEHEAAIQVVVTEQAAEAL